MNQATDTTPATEQPQLPHFGHENMLQTSSRVSRQPIGPGWLRKLLPFSIAVGILLVAWQVLATVDDSVPLIQDAASFLWKEITGGSHGGVKRGDFLDPLLTTLLRYLAALAIGIPLGSALGLLMGMVKPVHSMLNDSMLALLALPAIAWAFMTSLWFGPSHIAPILAVIFTVIPFMAVKLSSGVRNVDPDLLEMSKSFRVPRRRRVKHIYMSGARTSFFTGARLACIVGWNTLLIWEWFSASTGLGKQAHIWHSAKRYDGFMAWIFVFLLIIVLLDQALLKPLEQRHALRWQQKSMIAFKSHRIMR